MANKLKKVMKPILKQKCSEAYQTGYKDGVENGWKKKSIAYESEIDCLKHLAFATDNNVGSKWIPVTERIPENFVSVLGYMPASAPFPPVRECYTVGNAFFFPALKDTQMVSHWMPMPEPPKEDV